MSEHVRVKTALYGEIFMSVVLFFGIATLVAVVSAVSKYIEGLAFGCAYDQHRFYAYILFAALILVVGILELLLRMKFVVFTVPSWLYFIHLAAALIYLISFFSKWWTASPERRILHLWLSKPFWFFWWITAGTALFIGIWNAFII